MNHAGRVDRLELLSGIAAKEPFSVRRLQETRSISGSADCGLA